MKSSIFILAALSLSWYFTDLDAEGSLKSKLAPLGVIVFLIALALWLVLKAGFGGKASTSDAGGADFGGDA